MPAIKHTQTQHIAEFEEAREAVVRLSVLRKFLSPADEETLGLLMDKKFMSHLKTSLNESKVKSRLSPLASVLK